jgi:hypothetical protein
MPHTLSSTIRADLDLTREEIKHDLEEAGLEATPGRIEQIVRRCVPRRAMLQKLIWWIISIIFRVWIQKGKQIMRLNLEVIRTQNSARKGRTKTEITTLVDLIEQFHDALLSYGEHSSDCVLAQRADATTLCTCGLDALLQAVSYDPRVRTRRLHVRELYGVEVPLAALYEPTVAVAYGRQLEANALTIRSEKSFEK